MANASWNDNNDNWTTQGDWSDGVVPGSMGNTDVVTIAQGDPQINTDVGTIAQLTVSASLDLVTGGALIVTGATLDTGTINVAYAYGTDATGLTINGTLTNTGKLNVGNGAMNAPVTVTLNALTNFIQTVVGTINLYGASAAVALDINGTAGFGVASTEIGTVNLTDDAVIQFGTGSISTIRGALTLDGAAASVEDKNQGYNSALTAISSIVGSLFLENGAVVQSVGKLSNTAGTIGIDDSYGTGGSSFSITGVLTNTGTINIGNGALDGSATFAVGGLTNYTDTSAGTISLNGTTGHMASLNVNAAAGFGMTGVLVGTVSLATNAQIQFTSGSIKTITGKLTLNGAATSVLDQGGAANSALLGLNSVTGSLYLENGATVDVTGPLMNTGTIGVDDGYGTGNSTLDLTDALTNSGTLNIGNGALDGNTTFDVGGLTNFVGTKDGKINVYGGPTSVQTGFANTALLMVAAPAGFGTTGDLIGNVNLYQAGQIQFASGYINTIASGNELTLNGAMASISNDGTINSALDELGTVGGSLYLENGATASPDGDLSNTGTIGVDDDHGVGGSTLDITGTLTNSNTLNIGNSALDADATVDVGGLTNFVGTANGKISVSGSGTNQQTGLANTGLLSVDAQAGFGSTGDLIGNVSLFQAGEILFTSGDINTITLGSELTLNGAMASVSNDGNINTALDELGTIDGSLYLENGASVTTGALLNAGTLDVDDQYGAGSASLTVSGTLTNSNTMTIGNSALSAPTTVSVSAITNFMDSTDGTINVNGSTGGMESAGQLLVSGQAGFGAVGSLIGTVNLYQDAQIQFASGGIKTITSGSALSLNGAATSIQDQGGAANGALTGLTTVDGSITLQNGATVTTGTATGTDGTFTVGNDLTVSGTLAAPTINVASGGTLALTGGSANANGAVSVASGGTFEGIGSAGSVTVASGGTFAPGADPGTINTGSISLVAGAKFDIELGGTASGTYDQDDVSGTVSLGGATLDGSLVNGFTPTVGDSFTIISNDGSDPVVGTFAGLAQGASTDIGGDIFTINYAGGDGNDVVLTDTGVACYGRGTMVLTDRGEKPVETVSVGDRLVTAGGERRPVRWTGHRHLDTTKHRDPRAVWPVRVHAGAFGEALPRRDLWMSPGHNVFVGGVLMPVRVLVNGVTVTQEPVDTVTYWHVELDSHDVILAEGLPAESYLDTGNRSAFANGGSAIELNPDFEPKHWTETCVTLVKAGPEVEAARRMLLARAEELGHAMTAVHDLHVVAGGRRVGPIVLGPKRFAFTLPAGCEAITMASRTFVPCHVDPEATDSRVLGVRVRRLQVDGEEIKLSEDLSADGWHAAEGEPDHVERWTTGEVPLPAHARLVVVDLAGAGRYWIDRKDNVVALRA